MSADGRGNYLGADDALDDAGAYDDEDEHCAWCGRGGEMQSFEGRWFCGEFCANSWWYEWGHDD
jgi:ribosomal protein S27AE